VATTQTIRWRESFDEAIREASNTSKIVLLDFFAPT
jgi:hypothetical protein